MTSFVNNLPMLSIFLLTINALFIVLIKKTEISRILLYVSILLVSFFAVLITISTLNNGAFVYVLGHFPAPWGNELRAGPLEGVMSTVLPLVVALSLMGGQSELLASVSSKKLPGYYASVSLLTASMLAIIYTNDIFTAYVFIEISAITACATVAARDDGKSTVATIQYLVYGIVGSGFLLLGIAILYRSTGHLLMSSLRESIAKVFTGTARLPITVSFAFIALGLAIKSALFPFHNWLPWAHAVAPTGSSAILSGTVIKVYIILLIKLIFSVYSFEVCRQMHIFEVFFVLGLLGMTFGSIRALYQSNAKRMAAFSSVAQVGYIYMALGLGTVGGAVAACLQILVHSFTKAMIFSSIGRLSESVHHKLDWVSLRGSARSVPFAGIVFTLGGLSLCGIPTLAGFGVKYAIAQSALEGQSYFLLSMLVLGASSVLNALYYVPAILNVWNRPQVGEEHIKVRDMGFLLSSSIFILLNIFLGIYFVPVLRFVDEGINMLGSF